ncbi:MAG: glycoside hydrolase [Omnitrophica bacterium RIFCSPLOWO2_12_FULL_44_17]|uniref:Glycoside hydrolase n=1 Tax=Candidatus Danuiimicrobium aquiferis TaxID=1801832 RepID=A0A1G1KQ52_9BACT|nr:MAG: glycoside hydrolase [Omnitrophica bacterium RIFCSPHIGHO2_02_FULL_45_28]OGW91085.1 MAG: glycoside hydrolase [Omnitrophica bacterium RIFCSPHIGHO2_12_FULL_44_12]OGW95061.1 MAG: glycoside hydrolase [Omnitrophica bacterium RIFCSPLOWO2_12_FULL_44_17]OGX02981.1 MAG: glycoside hydrolase [Omnitrophica bacterium RIFCSPLOWO2_02_FULL_44_11]
MEKGFLSVILHAHLPYVRHPEHEYFLEETWLYEAITETYIPLIHMYEGLVRDRVPFRITMSLTPPLVSMLRDGLLQDRYLHHIDKLIELANKEIDRTRFQPQFHQTALHYYWQFTQAKDTFIRYNRDLISAFKKIQDLGYLEIITCGATHGFFSLINRTESAIRGQVVTAARQYEEVFHRRPIGIWLPECAYYPGVDQFLKEVGIRYFLVETHGILHASPRPKFGVFAPIFCPSGVAAFGRDMESSKQVWSAIEGYPGDHDYRDFYRDVGYDLEYDYIKPYITPDGIRINTGIKYFRITGDTDDKQPYDRARALEKTASHAANFMFNREKQAEFLYDFIGRKPIIVSPYDAELYGHWWYEGPEFLNFLIRKTAFDQKTIRMACPSDYFREYPINQVSTPCMSSWGWKGYAETWLSGANDWIYRHLHKANLLMCELADRYHGQNGVVERALNQAARELYLAQSSDWAFIMHTGTMVPYAVKRTKEHILNLLKIYDDMTQNRLDEHWLRGLEGRNNIFPNVDYRLFCESKK